MTRELTDENLQPQATTGQKRGYGTAMGVGPRKKAVQSDPMVHHGRHFGRTIHAMCNIHALLENAVRRMTDPEYPDIPDEDCSVEERKEKRVFDALIKLVPRLEEQIMTSSSESLRNLGDLLTKGANGARSDDTKSLKSAVIDWITPRGEPLIPPIPKNVKVDRGFKHEATGALLCPANLDWSDEKVKDMLRNPENIVPGDNWPIFVYRDYKFNPQDAWLGLFRSKILISAYRHVFTSPSSVEKEPKATRSGNARIHGMTRVTVPSLAYIATQVRFALSSAGTFSRCDLVTDSERFYNSVVDFLEDPLEMAEVKELLTFWNRQVFPEQSSARRPITKDSALAKLKERRILQNSRGSVFNT